MTALAIRAKLLGSPLSHAAGSAGGRGWQVLHRATGEQSLHVRESESGSLVAEVGPRVRIRLAPAASRTNSLWFDQRDCIQGANRCRAIAPMPSYSSGLT